jgi:hypothetical protein
VLAGTLLVVKGVQLFGKMLGGGDDDTGVQDVQWLWRSLVLWSHENLQAKLHGHGGGGGCGDGGGGGRQIVWWGRWVHCGPTDPGYARLQRYSNSTSKAYVVKQLRNPNSGFKKIRGECTGLRTCYTITKSRSNICDITEKAYHYGNVLELKGEVAR